MSARTLLLIACCVLYAGAAASSTSTVLPSLNAEGKPDDPKTLTGCTLLRWEKESWSFPYLPIRESGKYCVDRDYTADTRGCSHGCSGQFIDIRADNVEVDLRGHTLRSIGRYSRGISIVGSNVILRNGRLIDGGVSMNARSIHAPPDSTSVKPYEIGTERPSLYPPPIYSSGGGLIENMRIDNGPITAAGADIAIIRNTVRTAIQAHDYDEHKYDPEFVRRPFVETSRTAPRASISVYGPRARVEENLIEQTNSTGGRVPVFSILLRDARSASVRNNVIRNVGNHEMTVAVGLLDSSGAVVEGNRLTNVEAPVAPFGTKFFERSNR